jgi:CubicO group peptidase (beta-lactamase class C family)
MIPASAKLKFFLPLLSCCLLLGLSALPEPARVSAQSEALTARVDQVFAPWSKPDSPGCALAVIKDGKIIYQRGYGMADLEHNLAITPASVFYVGSVSKQFTAFAIALLAQQGKLSLDDEVRKHLPELPSYGAPITVRHLLHHTSGLRDYNTLLALAGRRGDEAFNNDDVLEITARQKELNFKPGEQFLYSNTGYGLLALIAERASGMRLSAFAEAHIFKPLGMTETHFHDDQSRLVKHRADGYGPKPGGGFQLDTPVNERAGAGGVFATVGDLAKWDQNFYDGRVGGLELIKQLHTPGQLNNGQVLDYAFGLRVTTYRGLRVVEHGGSLGGYRAQLTRFPDQRFSIACLCNLGSINPGRLANQVAEIYLADKLQPEIAAARAGSSEDAAARRNAAGASETAAPPTLTPAQLAEYAGAYESEELKVTYTLTVVDGKLYYQRRRAPRTALSPARKDVFVAGGLGFNFLRDEASRISGFTLDAGRVRNLRFVKKP